MFRHKDLISDDKVRLLDLASDYALVLIEQDGKEISDGGKILKALYKEIFDGWSSKNRHNPDPVLGPRKLSDTSIEVTEARNGLKPGTIISVTLGISPTREKDCTKWL
ncbi:hypothetical protein ACHAPU_011005 [Fusarium lateritium]